jgi:hypothetical protein
MIRWNKIKKDAIFNILKKDMIEPLVLAVREEIPETTDYTGMCNLASTSLYTAIKDFLNDDEMLGQYIKVGIMHGELRHNPLIPSKDWLNQHTWNYVDVFGKYRIYVDCTSQQFQKFFDDIPDYYISYKPPKWYYNDKKNPLFKSKFIFNINKKFQFKYKGNKIGIIEFCQYFIWGSISDLIYCIEHF